MNSSAQRESALDFFYCRINFERTSTIPYQSNVFKLDRMRRLLTHLGNPHLGLNIVHLAGTKGKGSTAHMISNILQQAGCQVGLYTSPHLERLEERFIINGSPIHEDRLVHWASQLHTAVAECDAVSESLGERGVTFFELTTAMAFLEFADRKMDAVILEVGLGGRLDSTNVCEPLVTAITSISFDHTKQLGNTLHEIAREKAGIIKPGVPIVSGVTGNEPASVIREVAQQQRAPYWECGIDFEYQVTETPMGAGPRFTYREQQSGKILADLQAGMLGQHQAANGATAVAVCRRLQDLGWKISDEDIRRGLLATRVPARIEVIAAANGHPTVVIDAAHNVASVTALINTLNEHFPKRPRELIFATSKDKDAHGMLRQLLPQFETVVLTKYKNNPRFTEIEELSEIATAVIREEKLTTRLVLAEDCISAWENVLHHVPTPELIVVAGSFFLAAELRPLLRS